MTTNLKFADGAATIGALLLLIASFLDQSGGFIAWTGYFVNELIGVDLLGIAIAAVVVLTSLGRLPDRASTFVSWTAPLSVAVLLFAFLTAIAWGSFPGSGAGAGLILAIFGAAFVVAGAAARTVPALARPLNLPVPSGSGPSGPGQGASDASDGTPAPAPVAAPPSGPAAAEPPANPVTGRAAHPGDTARAPADPVSGPPALSDPTAMGVPSTADTGPDPTGTTPDPTSTAVTASPAAPVSEPSGGPLAEPASPAFMVPPVPGPVQASGPVPASEAVQGSAPVPASGPVQPSAPPPPNEPFAPFWAAVPAPRTVYRLEDARVASGQVQPGSWYAMVAAHASGGLVVALPSGEHAVLTDTSGLIRG